MTDRFYFVVDGDIAAGPGRKAVINAYNNHPSTNDKHSIDMLDRLPDAALRARGIFRPTITDNRVVDDYKYDYESISYNAAPPRVDLVLDSADVTLSQAKEIAKRKIKAKLKELLQSGIHGEMDGVNTGIAQTRDLQDQVNILKTVVEGLIRKVRSESDTVQFRDEANVTHTMTPDEALDWGMELGSTGLSLYTTAWTAMANVDADTTVADVKAEEEGITWPDPRT